MEKYNNVHQNGGRERISLQITVKYGTSSLNLEISSTQYRGSILPSKAAGVADPVQETVRALQNPIGSRRLQDRVSPSDRVVILASDITRPSPSRILIPPILDELNSAGVKDEQISIIFGLGVHRRQTEKEKLSLVGEDIYHRVDCIDHDIKDCQWVGRTSRGTPVSVFQKVLEADFLVGTGNLEFHYFAGFSGGAKALCPGVCSRETIEGNHRLFVLPGAEGGRIAGNPVREDIEEVDKMVGTQFMVNAILNTEKEVVKVVAGDVTAAHRVGVAAIKSLFSVPLTSPVDIIITSPGGFPKDIDLYQSHKAIENASLAVKEGGIIILAAQCQDGLGEKVFAAGLLEGGSPEKWIQELQEKFILGRHKISRIAGIHLKKEIYMVSDLPQGVKERLFFPSFDTIGAAFQQAVNVQGREAQVLVMPYGISTLPVVEER